MKNESIFEAKAAMRREVRQRLNRLSAAERAAGSARISEVLQAQAVWQRARRVLLFASFGNEVDTWPMIRSALAAGVQVALPRFDQGTRTYSACQITDLDLDLVRGQLGIWEPAEHCEQLNPLDFILVPGVAFDLSGRRLGRGKGYYDRLLAMVSGVTCGVAFDEQLVNAVPVAPHDVILNCILTPTRWVELTRCSVLE